MNLQRIISWLIARTSSLFPARWRLPLRYFSWAWSKTVEPELTHLFSLSREFRCAVDVGTNHGYYAWKMARRFAAVYAFEANPQVDFDIRHFKKKNVRFFDFGLSDLAGMRMLHVPITKGIPIIGWASLAKRELPFADAYTQVQVRLERLDDQPFAKDGPVDLIKIDVEGHELEVLKGGLETIRRCKPVLIVENNAAQQQEILELLGSMGYRATTLAQLLHIEAESPNLIFLPE